MLPFDGVNPRSILVMDNASVHHVDQVLEIVDNAGCLLWFLPAYSPDMNPIEEVFSQVKRSLQNNTCSFKRAIIHPSIYNKCVVSSEFKQIIQDCSSIRRSWRSQQLIAWHTLIMLGIKFSWNINCMHVLLT